MTLTLYTEGFFDSAHYIENYEGKCSILHGHSWKVCVWVRGGEEQMDGTGILWDFSNITRIVKRYDHKNLNEVMHKNPTAENLTLSIYRSLKQEDPELLFKVRVYENLLSKSSYAEAGDF